MPPVGKKRPRRSSKRGKTYRHPVPFAEAVRIVGGLKRLERLAGNANTRKTWERTRLVPADRVVPALLRWWRGRLR